MSKNLKNQLLRRLFFSVFLVVPFGLFAQAPKASFTQDKTQGCLPLIVNFTQTATGNITDYYWDFGNGNTSILQSPGAVFAKAGVYDVKLVVTDNLGKKDSITVTTAVTVFDNPKAAYTGAPTGICEGQKVKFTDNSTFTTNPIKSWSWNFGDGKQSSQPSPENTYSTSGTYAVSLIVEDTKGCKDVLNQTNYISVGKAPTAQFFSDISGGCITPLTVKFTDNSQTSTGRTYSYRWYFGDGDSSTQQNPQHTYKASGKYDVTLVLNDGKGCTASLLRSEYISIGKTVANFDANVKYGCDPLTVNFENKSSNVPVNAHVVWYFGNGDSAVGLYPSYTYAVAGEYDVTLKITSPDGCNDTITKSKFIKVNNAPVIDFSTKDSIICKAPAYANFISNTPGAIKWEWNFGDSSSSAQKNPIKEYKAEGVYTVSLSATFPNGCVVTKTKPSYIKNQTQRAYFNTTDTFGCAPLFVGFNDLSQSWFGIKNWDWDFGDGTKSTLQNPIKTYTQYGKYAPNLTITDSAGCKATYQFDSIAVGIKVKPDFVANPRVGCKQNMDTVIFTNLTGANINKVDSFLWVAEISKYTRGNSPAVFDYTGYQLKNNPDSIDAKLIAISNGCYDTIEKKRYIVLLPPDVKISYAVDNCKLDTIKFTNNSLGVDSLFRWDLDGIPESDTNSFKRFLAPGIHKLIAEGYNKVTGCKDKREYEIIILPPLLADVEVDKNGGCAGDSLVFYNKHKNIGRGFLTFEWRLNGSVVATTEKLALLVPDSGVFDVTYTVSDMYNCVKQDTIRDIVAIKKTTAKAQVWPDKGCFPHTAGLIFNTTSGQLKNMRWVIGGTDTIPATQDTTQYTFNTIIDGMNTTGIEVSFLADDTSGCVVNKTAKVLVSSVVANFGTFPTYNCNNTDVSFFNTSTALKPVGSATFKWTINDTFEHTWPSGRYAFYQKGDYKFKLVVTDAAFGCKAEEEKMVTVGVKKLSPDFKVDKTKISCPPLVSTFTDNSTVENTSITNVLWRFGDGSASTEFSPVKNYFYPGSYDIVYKITDARGCSDSIRVPGKIFVGGPQGSPTSDKEKGCSPLTVNFEAINPSVGNIRWDLGDGVLVSGKTAQNTYVRPTTYQPYMVLEDSVGCVVFYPTKPIVVYPSPKPAFTDSGVCRYNPFVFTNQTDTSTPITFVWRFGNGDSTVGYHTSYQFGSYGSHNVTLEATSINGCVGVAYDTVKIVNLHADFGLDNTAACLGSAINAIDKSQSAAGIKQWQWQLGDGTTASGSVPALQYTKAGNYQLSLIIQDNNGCYDSAINAQNLTVYDTTPPPPPWAYRVTVEEDNSIRFDFSEYARIDFGKYIIYKAPAGKPLTLYKEINLRTDTVYIDGAVNPDTSAYTYKVVNVSFCGRYSNQLSSREHTTILLQGQPDTNVNHLFWSPYYGWDVVKTYHIYRKEPNKAAFEKIGTVAGTQTAYDDSAAYCNVTYLYYVVAEQDAQANVQFSRSNTIALTPIHKSTVQPGTIIRVTVEDDKNILIEFAPPTIINAPIQQYSIEKSSNGGHDYSTIFTTPTCCPSFLDKKVDVHKQSYHYRVRTTDYCADVSEASNLGKSILLRSSINADENVKVDWSAYQRWDDGVQRYELEVQNNNGTFVSAGVNNLTAKDTIYIDQTGLYNYLPKICYRVIGISNSGVVSYSNTDCVTGRSSLFVPNAFTPNGDGYNNTFVIVGAYIKTYKIEIFNRYGEKLYTSYSLEDTWDGTFKGEAVQDDVYIYVINAEGMDHKRYNLSGNVTVLN